LPAEEGWFILTDSIYRPDRRPGEKLPRLPPASLSGARRAGSWLTHPVLVHAAILGAVGAVLAYGLSGLSIVAESETWKPHAWVPRLLVIASAFLIATTLYRLIRRYLR
jgi:hypothetical protein